MKVEKAIAVAYMFFPYMLMCVVRKPSVPKWDRDGKLILSKGQVKLCMQWLVVLFSSQEA